MARAHACVCVCVGECATAKNQNDPQNDWVRNIAECVVLHAQQEFAARILLEFQTINRRSDFDFRKANNEESCGNKLGNPQNARRGLLTCVIREILEETISLSLIICCERGRERESVAHIA